MSFTPALTIRPPGPPFNHPQAFTQLALSPSPGPLFGIAFNTAVFTFGYPILRKGLTPVGVAHAWALGASVNTAFGVRGYTLVCLYFIIGTLVGYSP